MLDEHAEQLFNASDDELKARIRRNWPKLTRLSAYEVARLTDRQPKTIYRISNGEQLPGLKLALDICYAIGCSLDDLLED